MGKYIVGSVIRSSVVWLYDSSEEQVNVFHHVLGGTVSGTDSVVEDQISAYFEGLYHDLALDCMSNHLTHDRIEVLIEFSTVASSILPAIPSLDGTQSADPLPIAVSALILGYTEARRKIAKKYLPTFTEGFTTGGLFNASAMTVMDEFATLWGQPVTMGGGLTLLPVVQPAAGPGNFPIVRAVAKNIPAYQRRRRQGRGS